MRATPGIHAPYRPGCRVGVTSVTSAMLVRLGPAFPLRREERGEEPLDVVAQQRVEAPARTMIGPGSVEKLRVGSHRARLLVRRTEDDECDPCEHGGAGAHRTRLDGHVKRAVRESPSAEYARRLADREELSVRSGIGISLAAVAGARDDGAVADDRRTDRNVALLPRATGLFHRVAHEAVVVAGPRELFGHGERRTAVRPLLHTPRYRVSTSRRAASSAGVPAKTIVPLFITRTRCPTAVASPRFCSTRRIASPLARR